MQTATFDTARSEAFGRRMMDVLNHAALAFMTSLGHRTGLFDVLESMPASTSQQIAERAGLSERYVREWLGAMVTADVIEYHPQDQTFFLPREHAAFLHRGARPNNMAASMQWFAVLGFVEDHVLEAFRHGRGVPYSAYHRFHEVMAEESDQTVVAGLFEHILPLAPGLQQRLEAGIDVLDIGCGSGFALLAMAARFPRSRFVGYDLSREGIAAAEQRRQAQALGNVRFGVHDLAEMTDREAYDLITAFDVIHDQAKPAQVLSRVETALRRDGVYLMQDIAGSSDLEADKEHPLAPLLYTISCMHCMSVSLANGGPGLGAMWGKQTAQRMLADAGFVNVRVESLPHDIMNYYYVAELPPNA